MEDSSIDLGHQCIGIGKSVTFSKIVKLNFRPSASVLDNISNILTVEDIQIRGIQMDGSSVYEDFDQFF